MRRRRRANWADWLLFLAPPIALAIALSLLSILDR